MKKKLIFSIAAAAAILAGNPAMQTDAATIYPAGERKIVYYQSGTLNNVQINEFLKKYFNNSQALWKQDAGSQSKAQQPASTPNSTAPAPTAAPTTAPAAPASEVSAFEEKVVELTNQERAKNGLKALVMDEDLSKVAREKSRDMQANRYFSHTSPTYGSPFDMMKQFGVSYRTAGENIAMGQRSPEEVVQAWMNSEGHRKNILNANFTHIGVGYIEQGNYWTQMFIGK